MKQRQMTNNLSNNCQNVMFFAHSTLFQSYFEAIPVFWVGQVLSRGYRVFLRTHHRASGEILQVTLRSQVQHSTTTSPPCSHMHSIKIVCINILLYGIVPFSLNLVRKQKFGSVPGIYCQHEEILDSKLPIECKLRL